MKTKRIVKCFCNYSPLLFKHACDTNEHILVTFNTLLKKILTLRINIR